MPSPRFDPTVNLGHLLTFVGFVVAGFTAWSAVRTEIATVRVQMSSMEQRLDQLANVVVQNTRIEVQLSELGRRVEYLEQASRTP